MIYRSLSIVKPTSIYLPCTTIFSVFFLFDHPQLLVLSQLLSINAIGICRRYSPTLSRRDNPSCSNRFPYDFIYFFNKNIYIFIYTLYPSEVSSNHNYDDKHTRLTYVCIVAEKPERIIVPLKDLVISIGMINRNDARHHSSLALLKKLISLFLCPCLSSNLSAVWSPRRVRGLVTNTTSFSSRSLDFNQTR